MNVLVEHFAVTVAALVVVGLLLARCVIAKLRSRLKVAESEARVADWVAVQAVEDYVALAQWAQRHVALPCVGCGWMDVCVGGTDLSADWTLPNAVRSDASRCCMGCSEASATDRHSFADLADEDKASVTWLDVFRETQPTTAQSSAEWIDEDNASKLDLDTIEARATAATPRPWLDDVSGYVVSTWTHVIAELGPPSARQTIANTSFIAEARRDVHALVSEVRRLNAEYNTLHELTVASANLRLGREVLQLREQVRVLAAAQQGRGG